MTAPALAAALLGAMSVGVCASPFDAPRRRLGAVARAGSADDDAAAGVLRSVGSGGRRKRRRVLFVGALAVGALLWLIGPVGASGVSLAAGAVAAGIARARRRARIEANRAAVVELCRAVAAELRAGRPAGEAFAAAAEAGPDHLLARLRGPVVVARRGDAADLADALVLASSVGEAVGFDGLSRVAACWRVAATSGAALAPVIERVGDALHDEIDLARDVESSLAGPRSTIRLLAGLPVMGLLLGTAIGARPLSFLLGAWTGRGLLAIGLGLDLLGVAWAGRIAGHAARLG